MDNRIAKDNQLKVILYMTVLMLVLGGLGVVVAGLFHLNFSVTAIFLAAGILINLVAYYFSDTLILKSARAVELTPEKAPELFQMVEKLAAQEKLPMPKVYFIDDQAMNAFATGRSPTKSAVAVTRGLVEKLSPEEVNAVVAHEMTHIKNRDTFLMTAVAVLAGLISILADTVWRSRVMGQVQDRDQSGVLAAIGMIFLVFAPLAAMLIQLAISRKREFIADNGGAVSLGSAEPLMSALDKISRDRRPLPKANAATAHLYFSSPSKATGFVEKIFSTHPPVEERLAVLKQWQESV
jgi:heat shock protein HtpX